MIVRVQLLPGGVLPARATAGAAGLDCAAPASGCVHVGGRAVIPLGFALEVPPGWAAHVVSRSGLAKNWGVVEYWGTIDSDYRGEVKALLFNHGQETYRWSVGERVCQLLFLQVPAVELVQIPELGETARGPRGFGSTGDGAIESAKWAGHGTHIPYDLSPALRPYRVLDGDPSVGAVPCTSCGETFAHAQGCPETAE